MKYILSFLGSVVILGVIYGAYLYPVPLPIQAGTTTQGGTGTGEFQANVYGVNLAAAGANATSSSVLNSSGNDYYISAIKVGCQGVGTSRTQVSGAGLASLTFTVATTSTSAPAAQGAAIVDSAVFTIATSSTNFALSTSTLTGGSATTSIIWASGSYLTFFTNATNTAVCTFGADYFSS